MSSLSSSSEDLFQRTIQLNNAGAYLLEHRHPGMTHETAIVRFSEGLYMCREIVQNSSNPGDNDTEMMTSSSLPKSEHLALDSIMNADGGSTKIEETVLVYPSLETSGDGSTTSSSYVPVIYRHPITIPTPSSSSNNTMSPAASLQDETILSAILMFNQALAHHLFDEDDVASTTVNRKMVTKAAKLYEFAYSQIVATDSWASSSCLLLACLNNIGVAYHQLGQHRLAESSFEQLSSTLMFFVDMQQRQQEQNGTTAATTTTRLAQSRQRNIFFRNIFEYPLSSNNGQQLQSRKCFPAAAA